MDSPSDDRPAAGLLVSIEGGEGAGKSTVIAALRRRLEVAGFPVVVTREPGGTPLGEQIRNMLLDPDGPGPGPTAEALLFGAARAELTRRVLRPALTEGNVVLCDRFGDSTLAYQGYGRGLPIDPLRAMNRLATGGLQADLTLLLDTPVDIGLARRRGSGTALDRIDGETAAFHRRVREGFRAMADAEPGRWHVVDADRKPAEVVEDAWNALRPRLAARNVGHTSTTATK